MASGGCCVELPDIQEVHLDKNNVNSCLCFVAYVLSSFETSMDAKAMVMLDGWSCRKPASALHTIDSLSFFGLCYIVS